MRENPAKATLMAVMASSSFASETGQPSGGQSDGGGRDRARRAMIAIPAVPASVCGLCYRARRIARCGMPASGYSGPYASYPSRS